MASEIPHRLHKTLIGKIQVKYGCPNCGLELENALVEAGNKDTCPGCSASFVVPGEVKRKELEKQKSEESEKKRQEKLQLIKDVEQARKGQIEIQRLAEQQKKLVAADEQKQKKQCPFCMASIPISAMKCQFCAEFVDGRPTPQIIIQSQSNPGVAAVLSFFVPGLGQIYKGKVLEGFVWMILVVLGYFCLVIPGLVLHLCCVIAAAIER